VVQAGGPLSVSRTGDRVNVSGDGFDLSFTPEAGLERLVWRNHEIIAAGPRPQVWRGPTDNDGIKGLLRRNGGVLKAWLAAGLDRMAIGPATVEATEHDGAVLVMLTQTAACDASPAAVVLRQAYRIDRDCRIAIDCVFTVDEALADLPRLGVTLILPDAFEGVEWFGRGPLESYADRKRAARIGRFTGTARGQYVPYVMPQEHGNKTDLRWLEAQSPYAVIRFTPSAPCEGSISRFAPEDLFAATHTTDLHPRQEVRVNLDVAQRGLGTASCGPDTLERYRIGSGEHRLSFAIEVSAPGER
jgi:beta-galactosidase